MSEARKTDNLTLYGPPLEEATYVGSLTLGSFLLEVCERYPDNEALVFDDPLRGDERVSWTYRELRQQALAVAKSLIASGAGKGCRVGLIMGSRPECVASIFGIALAGGVVVPFSTLSTVEELQFLIHHADIDTLLTQVSLGGKHRPLDTLKGVLPQLDSVEEGQGISTDFPYLRRVVALGEPSSQGAICAWDDFIARGKTVSESLVLACNQAVSPADAGLIIYSSGTTSLPKGMLHVHRAPTLQAWHQAQIFSRTPDTRMWTTFPLFWTAGFNTVMGATLAAGACWIMQELFEPGEAIALIAREKVTEPYALPHHTNAMEEHPSWAASDFSSVRNCNPRSPFARHPKVDRDTDWNGVWGYGASETCAISICYYARTPFEVITRSTGRMLPGNMLRIIDPDTGDVLGPGQGGEMCIKGPTLMDRYVKKNREECFDEDGFFHTGDSGHYNEDGSVQWTGRMSDMIKTGGANVSPAEVERIIQGCFPTLKIGRIVGAPDENLGQIVVMCVVLQEGETLTEEAIKAGLRERLASYKVPKRVLFFDEEEIPMTSSGEKVKDAELRDIVAERLATEVA